MGKKSWNDSVNNCADKAEIVAGKQTAYCEIKAKCVRVGYCLNVPHK